MIRHWLTIAWRTVRGDPVFAAISILSLAIGCAGALLVGAYAREELTWDWWVPASGRMVRLDSTLTYPGQAPRVVTAAASGLAPLLAEAAPGVDGVTRVLSLSIDARNGEGEHQLLFGSFVDPGFLQVIELGLVEGDPSTALADPSGIVLSARSRERLFGREAALGRTLTVDGKEAVVTGVLARLPRNTTLAFDFLAPIRSPLGVWADADLDSWAAGRTPLVPTYVRADSRETARAWRDTLAPLAKEIAARHTAARGDGLVMSFSVTPFREMRFATAGAGGDSADMARLRLMILVAGALLFVSAFNYVSLSLARVVRRTREVGLRKAMGADRGHLVRQHLAESVAFTLIALVLGFGLADLVRPWLVRAMNMPAETAALHDPMFLGAAAAGGAVLAALVAAYPAAFLAGVKPATILQGRSGSTRALAGAIFALVALQFAAATALVTSVAVFDLQAAYLASAPLGYETEDRYFAFAAGGPPVLLGGQPTPEQARDGLARLQGFRAALDGAPGIISVNGMSLPVLIGGGELLDQAMAAFTPEGHAASDASRAMPVWVDLDFLRAMKTRLLAGRLFGEDFGTDRVYADDPGAKPAVVPAVVSRAALPLLGTREPADALGRRARIANVRTRLDVEIEVVGVVEDYYFRSLRYPASPVVFMPNPGGAINLIVHIDGAQREAALAAVTAALERLAPGQQNGTMDFEAAAKNQYQEETRWRRLVTGAAVLAVGVACLGLYGLTAFSASQRRREVGVRKSLGADEGQVLVLMLALFARPVLVGVAVGWGAAFYAMAGWLAGFARHAALTPAPFLAAGAAALAVAAATALFHALRAARTSPAIVLRTE